MFRHPSTTPPSTPDSRRSSRHVPSTTPAGPPPDHSLPSSTPAGPPPRDRFGNPLQFTLGSQGGRDFNPSPFHSSPTKHEFSGVGSGHFAVPGRPSTHRGRSGLRPNSSPPQAEYEDEEEENGEGENSDYSEEDEGTGDEGRAGEDGDEDEDESMGEGEEEDAEGDEEEDTSIFQGRSRPPNRFSQSAASITQQPISSSPVVRPAAKQSQYDLLNLAKSLAPNPGSETLRESDHVILETERLMGRLHESIASGTPESRSTALSDVAQELLEIWRAPTQPSFSGSLAASGRSTGFSPLVAANRLISLLFSIHCPGQASRNQRPSAFSLVPTRLESRHFVPIPKVLIDWLNNYHNTPAEIATVLKERRGYSASDMFWDAVHASTLRGNFSATLKLLKGAKFDVADTARDDHLGDDGYRGVHLTKANSAAESAIKLLQECPAVTSDDWDVKGQDWSVFRRRVYQALADLQEYAEGDSQNRHSVSQPFQASSFGISQSQNSFNLSMASRRAESNVPWSVYKNLELLYKQLLGGEEEIIAVSADWLEATAALAIWWNGEEDEVPQGSFAASRRSIARSQRVRPVDVTPVQAYCQRLSSALATVLESGEEGFSIATTSPTEVGMACIFDDNIEGVLHILRGWSLTLTSAIAEVATGGDWFRRADGILDQFDQSDLMVLSFNERPRAGLTKDDLLTAYATALASKDRIATSDGKTIREGWELSIQVLERLDDQRTADDRIEQLLNDLPLQSSERVDKIIQLCHTLGLSKHALHVALTYADHLRENTQAYGDTLFYYARAHNSKKIQDVLRILVAQCLVKSLAFPPVGELDDRLSALITSPKQTLTEFARSDPEAAQILSNYLSGYATIRKFYDLRDEEILAHTAGKKPAHRPMARKLAAANALMVIIASAASSIRGGLYDADIETVVQVDVLLCLLGEVLLFIDQPKRTLSLQQIYSLLAAVEDLDTAPSMIQSQCEACFSTALAAAHDGHVPSPRSMLQKSTSNLTTASSQYSLIGSAEFGSMEGQSTESSTVLVKGGSVDDTKRAWDWRKGFRKDASGRDVIRILRLGIAKEIARAFAEGET
ncbi:uncharacterized protein BDR25DRAFT_339916 [Lindgomyces ingoldianus]|uniref:Uncharacterized protein n=1 Tax=Lindgomyces ingoldianus TaxID=673940 RepID=A0ACB6RBA0_9PLEO|nr:uncharacterized protein BDR25DRAFT_339916 [Lindgomyces ingoldianus]KAF2476033.1 hypothetical protein BDR25DRAFT_339916 [Lindgomyces ingoldianus]